MFLRRDGTFLEIPVGDERKGGPGGVRALDALVHRAFRSQRREDVDTLYWLWAGPGSPLFGKDKMATFETYLVADKRTHEDWGPVLRADPRAAVLPTPGRRVRRVAGARTHRQRHVPVKLEKGESPMKRSAMAVTIDGAFSEAYGDQGYTLVIHGAHSLARHHHFRSVQAAVEDGEDIVPGSRPCARTIPCAGSAIPSEASLRRGSKISGDWCAPPRAHDPPSPPTTSRPLSLCRAT